MKALLRQRNSNGYYRTTAVRVTDAGFHWTEVFTTVRGKLARRLKGKRVDIRNFLTGVNA